MIIQRIAGLPTVLAKKGQGQLNGKPFRDVPVLRTEVPSLQAAHDPATYGGAVTHRMQRI